MMRGISNRAEARKKLLVISQVLPYPGGSGQQQRVACILDAARKAFEVHFLTCAEPDQVENTRIRLLQFCDQSIVLRSVLHARPLLRVAHKVLAPICKALTAFYESHYPTGRMELSGRRLENALAPEQYDCVLYQHLDVARSAVLFRQHGVPTVLDTCDDIRTVLADVFLRQGDIPLWLQQQWPQPYLPATKACLEFDGLITSSQSDRVFVENRLPRSTCLFHVPPGVDLARWPYSWQPASPPRMAFYGGLSGGATQRSAGRYLQEILPVLRARFPELQIWPMESDPQYFHGSLFENQDFAESRGNDAQTPWQSSLSSQGRPCPTSIGPVQTCSLALADSQVKTTGFMEKIGDVLRTMSFVLCRSQTASASAMRSRIVQAMALGVPVVADWEAIDGMGLEHGNGILMASDDAGLAHQGVRLLMNKQLANHQSELARHSVEHLYSLENTYGRFVSELRQWLS